MLFRSLSTIALIGFCFQVFFTGQGLRFFDFSLILLKFNQFLLSSSPLLWWANYVHSSWTFTYWHPRSRVPSDTKYFFEVFLSSIIFWVLPWNIYYGGKRWVRLKLKMSLGSLWNKNYIESKFILRLNSWFRAKNRFINRTWFQIFWNGVSRNLK